MTESRNTETDNATNHRVIMPPLIYGTAWKKERTYDLVLQAYSAGFRGFDTACQPRHYSEALVGDALKKLSNEGVTRSDYYLQTKYTPSSGQDPETVPYDPNSKVYDQVCESFLVSQQNLHTEYLDGFILHSPFREFEHTLEAWHAMEMLYKEGKIRQLGISNCYQLEILKQLYESAQVKPRVVQNRFYNDTGYDVELRAWCRKNNIIYQSFWTLTANPQLLQHADLQELKTKYQQTPAQILFNYLRQRQVIPLTGTSDMEHMALDLASFDIDYTDEELNQIDLLLTSQGTI